MTRIDNADLNLFEFDYDLTFMVFFLNADSEVYARYGGRDAKNADSRQSLAGLRYTMQSVLRTHESASKVFARKSGDAPRFLRDVRGSRRSGRCMHCHQVKETLNANLRKQGKWSRDLVWRYPLPENLGLELEVDRGNLLRQVREKSPASVAGLRSGDMVQRLNGVPIHSFADVQFALDRAPKAGRIEVVWRRGKETLTERLTLPEGWRKSDIRWRPSMQHLIPSARLYGDDLTLDEKKALKLPAQRLAFRQRDSVPAQARTAGVRPGDIILGIDDKPLEMDVNGFLRYVESNYLVGDRVTVNLLRAGERMSLSMHLLR